MILVEQQIIKSNHPHFNELRGLMSVSKSLYNMALYNVRQHYFESKNDDSVKYKFLSYVENWKKLKETDTFKALDSHCAQEIIKLVDKSFKSFFTLICKKKQGDYQERCSIPKYKGKNEYRPLIFPQFPKIKNGTIRVPKSKMTFKTKVENVKQFRFIHKGNHIVLEVLYEVEEPALLENNGRYAAIDLGIDNLCSVSSNCCNSFIINGKPVKSINQYYNKKKAKLQKRVKKCQNKNKSKKIVRLTEKRNR